MLRWLANVGFLVHTLNIEKLGMAVCVLGGGVPEEGKNDYLHISVCNSSIMKILWKM